MNEVLLKTRKFSIEKTTYLGPDGVEHSREVMIHPGAVVILPILDAGRIVMVKNFRPSINRELLELPAGTCEPNEDPIETAGRELIEETGYRAGTLSPLACFYSSPGVSNELLHAYVATDLTCVGQRLDPGEQVAPEICDLVRAHAMLAASGLHDAKTLAVLGIYFASQRG